MVEGAEPVFQMTDIQAPGGAALISYILIGAGLGLFAVIITRAVYAIEDSFERLPIHWMWWPAIGAFAVGIVSVSTCADLQASFSERSPRQ